MRILALDIGDSRIGLALSDALGITANPLETYKCKKTEEDVLYIANMAKTKQAQRIVIGLPVHVDGTEGERAIKTREFAKRLEKVTDIMIDFEDESLTTVAAEEVLIAQGVRWERRKEVIDKVAAAIILRCYLDRTAK